MFVKICGITNLEDARAALAAGADAVGFVLSDSPRRIGADQVADIVRSLPEETFAVGVFRHERPDLVVRVFEAAVLSAAQVHPGSADDIPWLRDRVPYLIEAVPATADGDLAGARSSPADLVLVDSARPGSGRTFDWSMLGDLPMDRRIVLAGGLSPENVAEAVARVRPFGVDVASGVEASAGRKDHDRVRLFVERARAAGSGRA